MSSSENSPRENGDTTLTHADDFALWSAELGTRWVWRELAWHALCRFGSFVIMLLARVGGVFAPAGSQARI